MTQINETQDILETEKKRVFEETIALAMECCTNELRNTSLLLSNPPQSSAAWDARNAINKISYEQVKDPIVQPDVFMSAYDFVKSVLEKWGQTATEEQIKEAAEKAASAIPPFKKRYK